MKKMYILMLVILLFIITFTIYFVLSAKISHGQMQIDEGQQQLAQGQKALSSGKAKLASGQRQLSHAQSAYRVVNNIPLLSIVNRLPVTDIPSKIARDKLAQGQAQVAQGRAKIKAGEAELAAGQIALTMGISKLKFFNYIRVGCGILAGFFLFSAFALGFRWRKSLNEIYKPRFKIKK